MPFLQRTASHDFGLIVYRIAKWGTGNGDVGAYSGQYHDDQLWRFDKIIDDTNFSDDYYRIYNHQYSTHKMAKWGKANGDWGTYSGADGNDRLWRLVPRYEAKNQGYYYSCQVDNR